MNRDTDFLEDMLDAVRLIRSRAPATLAAFVADVVVAAAVQHWLLVLGEAASRVSTVLRDSHSDVPWRVIIDTRNFMAHGYRDVDLAVIWNIVDRDLPTLETHLNAIIDEARPAG